MQRLDSLNVTPVWVNPAHIVESARVLMEGHDLSAICVLEATGQPVGILRRDTATSAGRGTRVGEIMEPVAGVLQANASLREAAELMVSIEKHYAPVMNGDEFRGMITALDLLDGLRRSWDPMTDLPWSDELRRWGAEQLEGGREIAVVFIDLDRFGSFNKRFGHVVGDRVLIRMADFLRGETDPSRDILVRYGGDEFAIGTLRSAAETQALADGLLAASQRAPLTESGETISFSVGVYGGQRTKERNDMHVQATLDDLINLASRRCVASKAGLTESPQAGSADEAEAQTPEAPADDLPTIESAAVETSSEETPAVEAATGTPSSEGSSSQDEPVLEETASETSAMETTAEAAPVAPEAPEASEASEVEQAPHHEEAPPLPAFMARPSRDSQDDSASSADPISAQVPDSVTLGEIPDSPEAPADPIESAVEAPETPQFVADVEGTPAPEEETAPVESAPVESAPVESTPVEAPPVQEAVVPQPEPIAPITPEATAQPERPAMEKPSVIEVQIEDDPNSLTHVVLKGGGRVWVGVGLRLGRTLESTVAYATGKALERAYAGRTLRIDAVREDEGRIVVEGTRMENGQERSVSATAESNSPEAVADATINAFLA